MICYRYPFLPNKIAQLKFAENLDACRWLYNRLLQEPNGAEEKGVKLMTYNPHKNDTKNMISSLNLENLRPSEGSS